MTEEKLRLDQIRQDYQKGALQEEETGNDPVVFFEKWFQEALLAEAEEANAMVLSTIDSGHRLHSRVVLLKGLEDGSFHFFTNYESAKARQMDFHSQVAALFFWKELERQVRLEGRVEKLPVEVSTAYFNSRPIGSRISAIASPQSQVITGREVLEEKIRVLETKSESEIVRPESWGGYKIIPDYMEFWQGRRSRLHDRIAFKKKGSGIWEKYRLAP
ncbi:MAG TPA: pyridoxamine 5'-phosphate oxidase [Edaphocola sp.]|nr:pyridoxamine 5'-phosphate oxidase [Edaphocola sp.]